MSKLTWDNTGERLYETGVKNGVLYPMNSSGSYSTGVAWNGLTSVTENPSGGEPTGFYADDIKYLNLLSSEEYGATVEAYMYPNEFKECIGDVDIAPGVSIGQQSHKSFGFCYRTILGNDVDSDDYGYKLHLIYGCMAAPSEKQYESKNDSPDPITLSWEISTVPVQVAGYKPTASVTIDSTQVDATKLAALEEILYGSDTEEARLPLPDEIATLMAAA